MSWNPAVYGAVNKYEGERKNTAETCCFPFVQREMAGRVKPCEPKWRGEQTARWMKRHVWLIRASHTTARSPLLNALSRLFIRWVQLQTPINGSRRPLVGLNAGSKHLLHRERSPARRRAPWGPFTPSFRPAVKKPLKAQNRLCVNRLARFIFHFFIAGARRASEVFPPAIHAESVCRAEKA